MQDFSRYYASEKDALEYQFKMLFFTLAIFACFVAYAMDVLALTWMIVLSSVLVTRWMIAFHELMHLKEPAQLDIFTRLLPIPFAPFNLGYAEYQVIHMGHHKFTASVEDPDAFHILGGVISALFGAITQHEQACYRYIRTHGLSQELGVMLFVRSVIFFALLVSAPLAFLAWWLVLRVSNIINDFVFFHLVHFRSGQAGTFPIPLPRFIATIALLIYGPDVVYGTMHHNIHHTDSRIAPRYLPRVALAFEINKSVES